MYADDDYEFDGVVGFTASPDKERPQRSHSISEAEAKESKEFFNNESSAEA